MANNQSNESNWVDQRLSSLDADAAWQPNATRGMAQLRDRRRRARRHRIEWIAATFAGAAAACIAAVVLLSPGACAKPNGCAVDSSVSAVRSSTPAFKQSGSRAAPLTVEVYTDYECPSCALLYRDTIPLLVQQYVNSGKVRLVHRDYPLPQHPYARLAARYANAAGSVGRYDDVVKQLFESQSIWNLDGNVDAQVALILKPAEMQRVRELVANDPHLDDTVQADLKMAVADAVNSTPTIVVISGGKRQPLAGVPQYPTLQAYLDQMLPAR
jgi:protein-disulfide isomerase